MIELALRHVPASRRARIGLAIGILTLGFVGLTGCRVSSRVVTGDFRLRLDDAGIEEEQDASLFKLEAEYVPQRPHEFVGGGMELEFLIADDDYFGRAEPKSWDSFFFVAFHPRLGSFLRVPIRLGPFLNYFEIDDPAGELRWYTLGLRGSLQPEIVLIRSREITEELAIFGRVTGSIGDTTAEAEPFDDAEDDGSSAFYGYEFEAGVKYRYEQFEIRGSWFYQGFLTDEADQDFRPDISGLDNRFEGFALTIALNF